MADLMHSCECSVRISPKTMLKAMSWFARIGQIETLSELLVNPLVKAFTAPRHPRERKEALPLPSGVRVAWERKVCAPKCLQGSCLVLGAFLLAGCLECLALFFAGGEALRWLKLCKSGVGALLDAPL